MKPQTVAKQKPKQDDGTLLALAGYSEDYQRGFFHGLRMGRRSTKYEVEYKSPANA